MQMSTVPSPSQPTCNPAATGAHEISFRYNITLKKHFKDPTKAPQFYLDKNPIQFRALKSYNCFLISDVDIYSYVLKKSA